MPTLTSFKDRYKGETIIVCGCGESLRDLVQPERFITIGVNDVGRLFHPDYLVVVNPRRQFSGDRFRFVETSQAKYLFTQLDLGMPHPNIVKFKLGTYGGTNGSDPNVLHYTRNSPYVAICLALHMGAKRIGIIGVDFTDNHFFEKTGRHALASHLTQINSEYGALSRACTERGVELVNLSRISLLTSLPRSDIEEFEASSIRSVSASVKPVDENKGPRVFFVHYRFLACGDVFFTGLRNAADELGLVHEHAWWDDAALPEKTKTFNPDILFVVHGRRFVQKWKDRFSELNTAVWLLDEPYEVDDTSQWSSKFRTVFLNDLSTITRHKNAHYLPVCYDPSLHWNGVHDRRYKVGFIGGHNETRERALAALAREGLLSYLAGGPWRDPALQRITLSRNVPPEKTAELYRHSEVVVNVFRDIHHYNRSRIPGWSMNPRIYEALACGALVVSEDRPEIKAIFPELPVVDDAAGLVATVRDLLGDAEKYEAVRQACQARLCGHTYSDQLKRIMDIVCGAAISKKEKEHAMQPSIQNIQNGSVVNVLSELDDWEDFGDILKKTSECEYELRKGHDPAPGAERGLVSRKAYSSIDLSFEVNIDIQACFIVKIHQQDKYDQLTNSYHLFCHGSSDYFARHNHIFERFNLNRNVWEKIRLVLRYGTLTAYRNGEPLFSVHDRELVKGHAFIGIKGGHVMVRNIRVNEAENDSTLMEGIFDGVAFHMLHHVQRAETPIVSIITTIYDRTDCLKNCIRSVKNLNFQNYEQIIVADCPPQGIVNTIKSIVTEEDNGRVSFVRLTKRHNNWGITPASVGLSLARGKYVCFLSDDNGYMPDHLDALVSILENNERLGFVYSSCKYNGRLVLDSSLPRMGRIDLGQPLFRKVLFDRYLGGKLPFNVMSWDWEMINRFIQKNVRWQHHNAATFLFRLKKYPQLTISLIHPSRGRPQKARNVYLDWMSKISNTSGIYIRHYLSLDTTDRYLNEYRDNFNGTTHLLVHDNDSVGQATNAAAALSHGEILIYLTDDFFSPPEWDMLLAKQIEKRNLDPWSDKFVFKVDDCLQEFNVPVLTIPIMSRALYKHLRYFWYPEYKSMFADMDLFEVCHRMGAIIRVPELKFEHRHYSVGKSQNDETYQRTNGFWNQGQELYNARKRNNFNML